MLWHVQVKEGKQSAVKKAQPWLNFKQKIVYEAQLILFLCGSYLTPKIFQKMRHYESATTQMAAVDFYVVF